MIRAFVLLHPQSARLVDLVDLQSGDVSCTTIGCGTTPIQDADLSEAGDFWPTYACWNSILFESSVILTAWEHAERLIGDDDVALLHSDVYAGWPARELWSRVAASLSEVPSRAVALTAPSVYEPLWREFEVPEWVTLNPAQDPMFTHSFDHGVNVWDFINKYDHDLFDWAVSTQPRIVYSHQFACSRQTFDALGEYLRRIVSRLRLSDTGLWTPHMFERLTGLFLVKHGGPAVHTTAFWHQQSSGRPAPGGHGLYGPRPFRYYHSSERPTW